MKKNIVKIIICLLLVLCLSVFFIYKNKKTKIKDVNFEVNEYGSFLTTYYSLLINDFDSAYKFSKDLDVAKIDDIKDLKLLVDFLNDGSVKTRPIKDRNKVGYNKIIDDVYLLKNKKYKEFYLKYKNNVKKTSFLDIYAIIWSGVVLNKESDSIQYINNLKVSNDFKHFLKGQVYVYLNKVNMAIKEFNLIDIKTLNELSYSYIYSFYKKNNKQKLADDLKRNFETLHKIDYLYNFKPYKVNFSLNDQIAITMINILMKNKMVFYFDISFLILKASETLSPSMDKNTLNYLYGLFFSVSKTDNNVYFEKIDKNSSFFIKQYFLNRKNIKNKSDILKVIKNNPLFVEAIFRYSDLNVQQGNKKEALKYIDKALENDNVPKDVKNLLLLYKSGVYLAFEDLDEADKILKMTNSDNRNLVYLLNRSIVWSLKNVNNDKAYQYAIVLIKNNPLNMLNWIALSLAAKNKRGIDDAIDILLKVVKSNVKDPFVFFQLGNFYLEKQDYKNAFQYFSKTLEFIDDQPLIISNIQKKINECKKHIKN